MDVKLCLLTTSKGNYCRRKHFKTFKRTDFGGKLEEAMSVEINFRKKKWLPSCTYNPQKSEIRKHLWVVGKNLDSNSSRYENTEDAMVEFMKVYNLKNSVKRSTCFKNPDKPSCIDLILTNKNTLTGPANCKKTTRHHVHLSLCAKSRKTNDAKSRKWPKTSIWAIFWRFRGQISPNCNFFWKIVFIKIEGHI